MNVSLVGKEGGGRIGLEMGRGCGKRGGCGGGGKPGGGRPNTCNKSYYTSKEYSKLTKAHEYSLKLARDARGGDILFKRK